MKFGYVSILCSRANQDKEIENFLQYADDTKVTDYPLIVTSATFKYIIVSKFIENPYESRNLTALRRRLVNANSITRLRGTDRNAPINIFLMTVAEMNEEKMLEAFYRFDTVNVLINSTQCGIEHELFVMANRIDAKYEEYEKYLSPFTYSLLKHMEIIE